MCTYTTYWFLWAKNYFFAVSELHLKSSSVNSLGCVCVCLCVYMCVFFFCCLIHVVNIISFIPFCCWVVFHYLGIPQFVYLFPCWWIYRLFHIFDSFIFIIPLWTFLCKSFVDIYFCFFWMAVVGLRVNLILLRHSKTVKVVIQSWAILYYHQQWEGFHCSIPYQHLCCQSLNFSYSHGYILVSHCGLILPLRWLWLLNAEHFFIFYHLSSSLPWHTKLVYAHGVL